MNLVKAFNDLFYGNIFTSYNSRNKIGFNRKKTSGDKRKKRKLIALRRKQANEA